MQIQFFKPLHHVGFMFLIFIYLHGILKFPALATGHSNKNSIAFLPEKPYVKLNCR